MLYLLVSILSFGAGYGLLNYIDRESLPAKKESVMAGAGFSAILAGIILCIYGIVHMAMKGGW